MIFLQLAAKYWYAIAIAALVALAGSLYVDLAHEEKAHAETKQQFAEHQAQVFDTQIKQDNARKVALADMDAKHTKELTDAKTKIEQLAADVRAGKRGLHVAATCPSSTGPEATGPTRVDDGTSPELTPEAGSDYFSLRAGIETATSQIAGLQDYVLNVCQK